MTTRRAMSMPAEMPADVTMWPSSTTWSFSSTVTAGKDSRIRSSERQCVVARRPSSSPAWPSSIDPVQTDVSVSTWRPRSAIHSSRRRFLASARVPQPPGTTKRSSGGHLSRVTSGITFNPPVAITVSAVSATSSTSKGDASSRRASSLSRVTENTSNGPQKSRTSTSGKIRMPTRLRSIRSLFALEECRVQLVPEQELAHRLEVRLAALELLGHGVDVAEPAVERAPDEDGRRATRVVRHVGHRLRQVDRVRRGQPDPDALVQREGARAADRPPDLLERSQKKVPRRLQLPLGVPHLGLDHRAVAERPLEPPRRLLLCELHQPVQHAPGDAERHRGEAGRVE